MNQPELYDKIAYKQDELIKAMFLKDQAWINEVTQELDILFILCFGPDRINN